MFGDLSWPINASRGFVSISWVSCTKFLQKWRPKTHVDWENIHNFGLKTFTDRNAPESATPDLNRNPIKVVWLIGN